MATRLDKGKVTRLVTLHLANQGPGTEFLVTLYTDNTIGFREKGRRSCSEIYLPLASTYQHACMLQGLRERHAGSQQRAMRSVSRGLLTIERKSRSKA